VQDGLGKLSILLEKKSVSRCDPLGTKNRGTALCSVNPRISPSPHRRDSDPSETDMAATAAAAAAAASVPDAPPAAELPAPPAPPHPGPGALPLSRFVRSPCVTKKSIHRSWFCSRILFYIYTLFLTP
jgi:hypothetical protein